MYSALVQGLLLAKKPCHIHRARDWTKFADDLFCKEIIKDAVRLMRNALVSKEDGHIFRSNVPPLENKPPLTDEADIKRGAGLREILHVALLSI